MKEKFKQQYVNGFSLIEVLIGIAVFSIAVFAIGTLLISSINGNAKARVVTESSAWASDRIEKLMMAQYEDLESSSASVEENGYMISWVVTENSPLANIKTIQVTVVDPKKHLKGFTFQFQRAITY